MRFCRMALSSSSASSFVFTEALEPRLFLHGSIDDLRADLATPEVAIHARAMTRHGAHGAKFVVRRDGPVDAAASYRYLIGGSAKNGRDYFRIKGVAHFRAGKATAAINVKPKPGLSV